MYTNKKEKTNNVYASGPVSDSGHNVLRAISPVIVGAIGLTIKEMKVLGALMSFQMGRDVAKIGRVAGLPRTTTLYTLKKLEKRGLVFTALHKKRQWWRYKKGLEYMKRKSGGGKSGQLLHHVCRGGHTIPLPMKKRQES